MTSSYLFLQSFHTNENTMVSYTVQKANPISVLNSKIYIFKNFVECHLIALLPTTTHHQWTNPFFMWHISSTYFYHFYAWIPMTVDWIWWRKRCLNEVKYFHIKIIKWMIWVWSLTWVDLKRLFLFWEGEIQFYVDEKLVIEVYWEESMLSDLMLLKADFIEKDIWFL